MGMSIWVYGYLDVWVWVCGYTGMNLWVCVYDILVNGYMGTWVYGCMGTLVRDSMLKQFLELN